MIFQDRSVVLAQDDDHPLIVAAKKDILGTSYSTTLEQVRFLKHLQHTNVCFDILWLSYIDAEWVVSLSFFIYFIRALSKIGKSLYLKNKLD